MVVEVVVGGWGRAGLALLAQPQTCDSSASGNHHREQWREQGAWPLGAPALSVQESKGTQGLQASPPFPHPATAVCLGTGTHSSRGAQLSGKSVPELQMWGLVARLGAQKSGDSGSAPCPGCKTPLQAHYCGSLGLSFPTGSSSTTPTGLAAYHSLACM